MNDVNGMKLKVAESPDLQEPYKGVEAQLVKDDILYSIPDSP